MQSAPASFRRRTDQTGRAGRAGGRDLLVVAGLFVGQQQSGALGARLGRRQTPLRIQQDGAGVLGENFGDVGLKLGQALVGGPGSQGLS